MSLPEITALTRVLARSDAKDARQQARNRERLDELRAYLQEHADPGINACLTACSTLIGMLAEGRTPEHGDVLAAVCTLMATVEKHWCGTDPDVAIATGLYGDGEAAEPDPVEAGRDESRTITSRVHGAKRTVFKAGDIEEAQHRIHQLKRTPRLNEMVLGELLVELGHVSAEDIQDAIEEQTRTGEVLGEVLVARGALEEDMLEDAILLQLRLRAESTLESLCREAAPPPKHEPMLRLAGEEVRRQKERGDDTTLGAILMRQGAINQGELERALAVQRASGLRLGEALVDMQATCWETINRAIELQRRLRSAAGLPGRRVGY
jgi:hypothetical protein